MRILVVLLAACALLAPQSLCAHSEVPAEAREAVAVVESFGEALKAGDLKRVESLLSQDVLVLESGGAERSRAEYFEHHAAADAAFLKGATVKLLHRLARVEGALAWVASETETQASAGGKPLTMLGTETILLRRQAEGWRIVHIHWSSRTKKEAK